MVKDVRIRTEVTRASHYWFFLTYFSVYIKYPFADFHREMFAVTEDETCDMATVMAFRGSGKSTIFTLSYPIWAVLGKPQRKFILLVAQTQAQARLYLTNLKREFEGNGLLATDLGPFNEGQEEWSAGSLVIPKYGARITAISTEQSIRGIRHGSNRPDLIICDDLEDLASVKTHEGREKMWQWLMGDVIPSGDRGTRVIIVGNMLHESSLLMRLKGEIEKGERDGVCRRYPLLNDDGTPTWPGKFKTSEDVQKLRRSVDDSAWNREYILKNVSGVERVIHPEWIQYYDELPPFEIGYSAYRAGGMSVNRVMIGVDVAISQSDIADFTAFVPIVVYSDKRGHWKAYVLPHIVSERLTFPGTVERLKTFARTLVPGTTPTIYVEDVGYQRALVQQLASESVRAESFSTKGLDKRERIAITSLAIKGGQILFPKTGAEALIRQLVGFGQEKHDDIADAFTLAVRKLLDDPPHWVEVQWIDLW